MHTAVPIGSHVAVCCINMWIPLNYGMNLSVTDTWGNVQVAQTPYSPPWGKMSQIHQWCCPAPVRWSDSPHWGTRTPRTLYTDQLYCISVIWYTVILYISKLHWAAIWFQSQTEFRDTIEKRICWSLLLEHKLDWNSQNQDCWAPSK